MSLCGISGKVLLFYLFFKHSYRMEKKRSESYTNKFLGKILGKFRKKVIRWVNFFVSILSFKKIESYIIFKCRNFTM